MRRGVFGRPVVSPAGNQEVGVRFPGSGESRAAASPKPSALGLSLVHGSTKERNEGGMSQRRFAARHPQPTARARQQMAVRRAQMFGFDRIVRTLPYRPMLG
jgi:hypothetical protein